MLGSRLCLDLGCVRTSVVLDPRLCLAFPDTTHVLRCRFFEPFWEHNNQQQSKLANGVEAIDKIIFMLNRDRL